MADFFMVACRSQKRDNVEIYPKFIVRSPSKDLMIRGGDFYAVWIEERGLWSTTEQDAIDLVDGELDKYYEENRNKFDGQHVKVLHLWDAETGMIDRWHKLCKKDMRDMFHSLDEKIIFQNQETKREDYASKKLPYPLVNEPTPAYEKLVSTLYSPIEKRKIEWAIGSIVSGDSRKLQKFVVLYGEGGTGKSTILNIIEKLFEGFCANFTAKDIGSASNQFALEAFRSNPLVAIDHDAELSKIEDNTRLNMLVSHDKMIVNEKFKATYANAFKAFLFVGSNKPVKITDAKSGLIRRLIDVSPTGNLLSRDEYNKCVSQINFELGGIAKHCLDVYEKDPGYYDSYIPTRMMNATNDFYNFMLENYYIFEHDNKTTLAAAWESYNSFCAAAAIPFKMKRSSFGEELKNYFRKFELRHVNEDGTRIRNYYEDFRVEKFEDYNQLLEERVVQEERSKIPDWLNFLEQPSLFDKEFSDYPAQYATKNETPVKAWNDVKTILKSIDTSRLHYVKVPIHHIVIDFDLKDENGEKNLELNIKAASEWPKTYAELSKSGKGIHLHYIYTGDPKKLQRIYKENVEIKVFVGNSSLRRQLSRCNNEPVATISSGLPLKGEKESVVNKDIMQTEKGLRTTIKLNLLKKVHPDTHSSVSHIKQVLDNMYNSGIAYDVSDLYTTIWNFAASSSNQAKDCLRMVNEMKFKSEEEPANFGDAKGKVVFYDVEVFPNLLLINWKKRGKGEPVTRMINPSGKDVQKLLEFKLIGFNCRRYDNHILHARIMGANEEQIYDISNRIISGDKTAFFGDAYNYSYTDVYDFCSKKQSLKKWEIELGIHHKELGLPWDEPVPEDKWQEVAEYCDNDVLATEAVFEARQSDFLAREILADIAGMTVNDTTNSLTTRIIFGANKNPQTEFCYRDLSKPSSTVPGSVLKFYQDEGIYFEGENEPFFYRDGIRSILPFFPGYKYEFGKSIYRGEEVGEGGYVYAETGMYGNVALLDIASMHPSSAIDECLFGPVYTKRFKDIKDARVFIKHKDYESAGKLFDGKLKKWLKDEDTADGLAQALKIAINSVYGLTSAKFQNAFRDPRNVDNIVAKRGALFMVDLKHEVQARGFTVAHIKTDSIKIPNATPEIIKFVMDFGKKYGYDFEHEATYDRMCLVNDAVYIARYKDPEWCEKTYGYIPKDCKKHGGQWTATGTQFQVPYVFKTLFTKEPIEFEDLCETKAVSTALYLDMNEPKIMRVYQTWDIEKSITGENIASERNLEVYLPMEKALKDFSLLEKALAKYKIQLKEEELHDYKFVGKVGRFCPIKIGKNGGALVREKDGKFYAATGSKGYRWLESEVVKNSGEEDKIDRSYYDNLVTEAVHTIAAYGDFEWFVSDEPYVPTAQEEEVELPWAV